MLEVLKKLEMQKKEVSVRCSQKLEMQKQKKNQC